MASILGLLWGTAAPDLYANKRIAAYKSWVATCVSAISDDVADTIWHLEKKTAKGQWERVEHEAMDLLNNKANPIQSGTDLMFATSAYLKLDGNSFWWVIKDRGNKIREIWPLDPSKIVVKVNKDNLVSHYETMDSGGRKQRLDVTEIIHHKLFNPQNLYRGMGVVEQAALAIDTDEFAAKWNRNFFFNEAMPSAALETDQELTKEQAQLIEATWKDKHQGVGNAHKIAILHSGLKFSPVNPSQRDMEFLEQRRYGRDEILAMFRVPKMILGIVEDVNRANAEASDYIFAKRVVKPLVQAIANTATSSYLPMWKLDPKVYRVWYDDPVPQNQDLIRLEDESGIKNGYFTINEVRQSRGLQPVDNGDKPLVQASMIPLDEVSADVATRTQPSSTSGEAKKKEYEALEKGSQQRVRFIKRKIKAKQEIYKQHLLQHKSEIVKGVKKELKTVAGHAIKKDKVNQVVNTIFKEFEKDWINEIDATNVDTYNEVMVESGAQAFKQVKVNGTFNLENQRAVDWMRTRGLEAATAVAGTIKEQVRDRLTAGLANGDSVDDIAANIAGFFDQVNWRALRIARTEVISSYSQGSLEGYRQSGVVKGKTWMIIDDDRVDDECVANADQGTIGLEDLFASGQAAPPVHPNCRCSVQPVVE